VTHARVSGKFLTVGGERHLVRGVAYGTFAPDQDGVQFPPAERIAQDFGLMAASGINTVRTYTPPPVHLLDEAARHGLRVMIGLPWSQHIAFLSDRDLVRRIRRETAQHVREMAAHPAALLFAVGNEIPPSVVRWHGAPRVEDFLRAIYLDAKAASPESLLTYVNYPPTEYLDTECFDVTSFNGESWLANATDKPAASSRGVWPTSDMLHVAERWRRTGAGTLEYEATVDDPAMLTGQWKTPKIVFKRQTRNRIDVGKCFVDDPTTVPPKVAAAR